MPVTSPLEPVRDSRDFVRADCHTAVDACLRAWPDATLDAASYGYPHPPDGPTNHSGHSDPVPALVCAGLSDDEADGGRRDTHPRGRGDLATGWLLHIHDLIVELVADANRYTVPRIRFSWPEHLDYQRRERNDAERVRLLKADQASVNLAWHQAVDANVNGFPSGKRQRDILYRLADLANRNWPVPPKKGSVVGGVTVGERGNRVEVCDLCQQPIMGPPLDRAQRIGDQVFHLRAGPGHGACHKAVLRSRAGRR